MNKMQDWKIQNNNPAHWQLDGDTLKVQVSEGNIWGSDTEVDNLFVRPVEKDDYSAQVAVNIIPKTAFEQAGLGIFWDNNNYIKISKEMFNGRLSLVFASEQKGFPQVNQLVNYPGSDATLKLEKKEGMITASFQMPGEDSWHIMGAARALSGNELGVVLYTFSGTRQQPTVATFSGFDLSYL